MIPASTAPQFPRAFQHGRAIAADDAAHESALLQRQTERSADQAGSDDGDLLEKPFVVCDWYL